MIDQDVPKVCFRSRFRAPSASVLCLKTLAFRYYASIMNKLKSGIIVAIDGPAGSGKSTAARMLAEAEGYTYLNTGAMYRAVTFLVDEGGLDPEKDPERVVEIARRMYFEYVIDENNEQRFRVASVEGQEPRDVTPALFTAALTLKLKPVVNNEGVREVLVGKMRDAAYRFLAQDHPGVILEGRDIGTVVFPDAFMKFYIHASLDQRAQRRAEELAARGEVIEERGLKEQIEYRDKLDESRAVGPLKQAEDAVDIDTTSLDPQQTSKRLQEELAKKRSKC